MEKEITLIKSDGWWKYGVVYQIYPRSFYDSNGDGIGDIPGVIEKLDYLSHLGVDAIWLSPVNTSPMFDFGYDISNYNEIDPVFGTMSDYRTLIDESHTRGIHVIMDLVLNHTSHLHPWFVESRSSTDNPKRDWYIWDKGDGGRPPNNWISIFGSSAWKYDSSTGEYYYHSFMEEQPDLNWRNPGLKEAMFDMIRFWLDLGVDGFRLDVINLLIKDLKLRNNPVRFGIPLFQKNKYNRNRKELHGLLREVRKILDQYNDTMSVGEIFMPPPGEPELSAGYLGSGEDELHLAFDFSLIFRLWSARSYYKCIERWMNAIPVNGWPCHVLSNHDQPRSMWRYNWGNEGGKRSPVAAALLLTLKGTPFIYYGEEIGMKNSRIGRKDIQDPFGKKFWPLFRGRDSSRTPMQWSPENNGGFTVGRSWLPVGVDYKTINVKNQMEDKFSLLNFYRDLIEIRKQKKALQQGDWVPVMKGYNGIIAYYRVFGEEVIFVALNFTGKIKNINIHNRAQWKNLLSTHKSLHTHYTNLKFSLDPYEATIIEKIGPFS